MPVRPRRRADPDRDGPRRGLEGDVRRVPAQAGGADGEEFVPFDPAPTTTSTSTASRARTACGRSSPSRGHRRCPRATPDDPPDAETVHGLGDRKNELVLRMIRETGVEVYEGSVRYLEAARDAGLRRAVVSASANCREVLVAAGIEDLFEVRDRRRRRRARGPARQAGAGYLPRRRARRSASRPRRPPSSRTRSPASRRAAAGGFGCVVGVDRVGQADALREHGADIVVAGPRRAAGGPMIEQPLLPGRAVGGPRDRARPRACSAQTESVFALSNGHIGLRGNLDEGEPHGLPGTYLNGFYETLPLPYAEAGYGYPESGQTLINVTNGKLIRLLVDDEPFDVRYGELRAPRARRSTCAPGVLRRRGRVGLAGRAGGPDPLGAARLVRPAGGRRDPLRGRAARRAGPDRRAVRARRQRAAAGRATGRSPRRRRRSQPAGGRVLLATTTPRVGARPLARKTAACGWPRRMDHVVDGPAGTQTRHRERARTSAGSRSRPARAGAAAAGGEVPRLRLVEPALAARRCATRSTPRSPPRSTRGWDGLLAEQRAYLDDFWDARRRRVEGDPELQQAVRFALFHVLQAGARAEQRAIPAKGLTGPGYDGHTFWDTETFVLPVLTYTRPRRRRATPCGGGTPRSTWRRASARGAGLAGRGVPVAHDPRRGVLRLLAGRHGRLPRQRRHRRRRRAATRPPPATTRSSARSGFELLVETARLWRSLGHHDADGRFRIDGVTGPDEYTALVDNNVYTNLMAARNLRRGGRRASSATRSAPRSSASTTRRSAPGATRPTACSIPYDEELGVHPQSEGFTALRGLGLRSTAPEQYPLLLHYPVLRSLPQARSSSRPTSSSRCYLARRRLHAGAEGARLRLLRGAHRARLVALGLVQAVVAAEVGHLELAYDYFGRGRPLDLDDLTTTPATACTSRRWPAPGWPSVAGFGGMRDHDGSLSFAPRLPRQLSRLAFGLLFRGRRIQVAIAHRQACYTLLQGASLDVTHHGTPVTLVPDEPVTRPIPKPAVPGPAPAQPPGRAPARRLSAHG